MLTNFEQKTLCGVHNYLNDFYCLHCNKEICSHCLFMSSSPHQSHDTIRLREYFENLLQKNKDFSRMCHLVKQKYDSKPRNPSKVRQAITDKECALARAVDKKIN